MYYITFPNNFKILPPLCQGEKILEMTVDRELFSSYG